jgi:outer membrane protein assembly factor BamB
MRGPFALAGAALLACAACAGSPAVPDGCGKDSDCEGARVCGPRGRCTDTRSTPHAAAATGDSAATEAPPAPASGPFAMYGGNAQHTGRLAGAAPGQRPAELWSLDIGQPITSSPTIGPDGAIYVAAHDGKLHAVSPDGKLRWSFATGDRIWSTPALAEDGTVYTGSDDDHLYAIDGSGAMRWRFRVGACEPPVGFGPEGVRCDVDGGPTIGPDGTVYTGGDGVYAVWPDGTLRWKLATGERVTTAPALMPEGGAAAPVAAPVAITAPAPVAGTVYAGALDDALYAVQPDGTRAWTFRTGGDIEAAPAVGQDGSIYFGSDDDKIYALAPDGTLRWAVVTGGDVRSSPALAEDGTIYAGSYDGHLYAIEPGGRVKWRFAAAGRIHGAPAVAANGIILFGSQDDHLYAVAPDGALLWYLAFGGDVDATPVLSSHGVLYAASDDGTLRAFR